MTKKLLIMRMKQKFEWFEPGYHVINITFES